jgi:hypothetical protein
MVPACNMPTFAPIVVFGVMKAKLQKCVTSTALQLGLVSHEFNHLIVLT